MATAPLEMEIGHGNAGLIPWSAFSDVTEPIPELAWPLSVTTYSAMRTGCAGRLAAARVHSAIRRYGWYIDPNGARDEVVGCTSCRSISARRPSKWQFWMKASISNK
jgi:hypothetical protein